MYGVSCRRCEGADQEANAIAIVLCLCWKRAVGRHVEVPPSTLEPDLVAAAAAAAASPPRMQPGGIPFGSASASVLAGQRVDHGKGDAGGAAEQQQQPQLDRAPAGPEEDEAAAAAGRGVGGGGDSKRARTGGCGCVVYMHGGWLHTEMGYEEGAPQARWCPPPLRDVAGHAVRCVDPRQPMQRPTARIKRNASANCCNSQWMAAAMSL